MKPLESTRATGAPRRPRPDHPEDFGRGLLWRLGEALLLGVVLPSPPPVPRMLDLDDEQHLAA